MSDNPMANEPLLPEIVAEVSRAMAKFPTWPTDPLHALAVLGEEYGELNKAVLQSVYEPHKSGMADVRAEAVQTAAMALRFLASMDRYELTACDQHKQSASVFLVAPAPRPVAPQYCDFCGAHRGQISTHCAPPFRVQPHAFTGKHPADALLAARGDA